MIGAPPFCHFTSVNTADPIAPEAGCLRYNVNAFPADTAGIVNVVCVPAVNVAVSTVLAAMLSVADAPTTPMSAR